MSERKPNASPIRSRIESLIRHFPRVIHIADVLLPEMVKGSIRRHLFQEQYPMQESFTRKVEGVEGKFWIRNFSDWYRITRNNFEGDFAKELVTTIRPGDVFLAVGAAQGLYSILAAKVGAEDGDMVLNTDLRGTYAPSFRRTSRELSQQVRVPVRTLDKLIAEGGIKPPSVVKIDVEGTEGLVLEGMRNLLTSDNKPRHLFIEVHELYLPQFGMTSQQVLRQIADMGYVPSVESGNQSGKHLYHFIPK